MNMELILRKAFEAHQAKDFALASKLYLNVLQLDRNHPLANHNLGTIYLADGKAESALQYFHRALESQPNESQFWISFAKGLMAAGRHEEAYEILGQGRVRGLDFSLTRDLLVQLFEFSKINNSKNNFELFLNENKKKQIQNFVIEGKIHEAEQFARTISLKNENSISVWLFLSKCYISVKNYKHAYDVVKNAIKSRPDKKEAHLAIAHICELEGHLSEAEIHLQDATCAPNSDQSTSMLLAQLQIAMKVPLRALDTYKHALVRYPKEYNLWLAYGNLQADLGAYTESVNAYQQALGIKPRTAELYQRIGDLQLNGLQAYELASKSFMAALDIEPDSGMSYLGLGKSLFELNDFEQAELSFKKGIRVDPKYIRTYAHLGNLQYLDGRYDEAQKSYECALDIDPADSAGSCLLFMDAYNGRVSPETYLENSVRWNEMAFKGRVSIEARKRKFHRDGLKRRKLRIGYMSGDFFQHAVSLFFQNLLANHDRSRVEITCFTTNPKEDEVTAAIQSRCDRWYDLTRMSDDEARNVIEADGVDVLIDMSGHTSNNRLGIIARRAAPVQAHYLGYFATTGLSEMDYFIGDEVLIPKKSEALFTEKIWRLPRIWLAYQGHDALVVRPRLNSTNSKLTLGSFNNLPKINDKTITLWAQILLQVPNSQLLLKTKDLRQQKNRDRITKAFATHGIEADRLRLLPDSESWVAHMSMYEEVDVALDPVGGVGGGTTTCDALWMGVPVVTLAGSEMAQRMSASMLQALGQSDWIANNETEYISKVIAILEAPEKRFQARCAQREKMKVCALCDSVGLASELEQAYVSMFELWLAKSSTSE